MSRANLNVFVSDTNYWEVIAKVIKSNSDNVWTIVDKKHPYYNQLKENFTKEKFNVIEWPFGPWSIPQIVFHIAFLHKNDTPSWNDVCKKLWENNLNLPVVTFSGSDCNACTLEKVDDKRALFLGITLLKTNLSQILRYCKDAVSKGEQIEIQSLYKIVLQIPWRYEYFLELSQRLLALNDENKAVVKKIIYGKGAEEGGSYEQRCVLNNERNVEVIVDNVKCKKNECEVFADIKTWVSELLKDENYKNKNLLDGGQDYTCLYSNIYNCLEALCNSEREKILEKGKYSPT